MSEAKKEHWRQWGIDGMPKDKQRLAEATWEAALSSAPEERPINDAIKVLEDSMDLRAIGDDVNVGLAWAIQLLYNHRNELRQQAMQAESERSTPQRLPTPEEKS